MDKYAAWLRVDEDGLELGKQQEDGQTVSDVFVTKLTPTQLGFYEGQSSNPIAYFSNQSMYITKAEVSDRLIFGSSNVKGYFDWVTTTKGMGIHWRSNLDYEGT